jgi:hypothetical protein
MDLHIGPQVRGGLLDSLHMSCSSFILSNLGGGGVGR